MLATQRILSSKDLGKHYQYSPRTFEINMYEQFTSISFETAVFSNHFREILK